MKIFTIICAAAVAVCGSLNASGIIDTVSVRFDTPVTVGSRTLPAGNCTIHIVRGAGDAVVLSVTAADGETSNVLVNRLYEDGPETNGNASVILERRADGSRFEQLWLPNHTGFAAQDAE